ncbi:MAG: hypothetical protein INR69_14930 [Mucilaginibacter polytrichastri]|nr:hypothetical protein [Mucilaginibacter polytrichastri]
MIQILKQPGEVALARNPVVFGFKSDNLIVSGGAPFMGKLYFPQPAFVAFPFKLSWGGIDHTFLVLQTPSQNGYDIQNGQGKTPAQFVQGVTDALKANYYVDRDFEVSYGSDGNGPYALFVSKKQEVAYNIAAEGGDKINFVVQQVAYEGKRNKNFKILLRLMIELPDRSAFEQAFETYLETDDDGYAENDLSGALTSELLRSFDRPNIMLPVAMECRNSVRRYFLQVAEVYGDKQTVQKLIKTDVKTAVLGGFSKEKLEESLFPNDYLLGSQAKYLTHGGLSKVVRPEQPEFLTWMALAAGYAGIYLEVKLVWADGSTQTHNHYAFQNVPQYGKYCWPVGILQNNYHLIKEEIGILRYECTVKSSLGTVLSETRTYITDYQYRPYTRYFLFLSSMGTYNTLVTYGKGSSEYERTAESAEISQGGDYRMIDGDEIEFEATLQFTESVTSGYVETRQEIREFRDLFLSSDRFVVKKGRSYPVSLASKNIKEFADGENLYAISFEIGTRLKDKLWTYDEKEDVPSYLLFPIIISGQGAAGTNLPENYFDYRYYRKTETYSKTEVDQKIAGLQAQITANLTAFNLKIADLQLQINNRALLNHNHDDRYEIISDIALPFVVTSASSMYSYVAPNSVITDERLIDLENYPVTNNTTNIYFRREDLIYDPVAGKLTIKNFQLLTGDEIRIG